MSKQKWICTDPDNNQYRLDEGQDLMTNTKYRFKQNEWEFEVDIAKYDQDYIDNILLSYGYKSDDKGYFVVGQSGYNRLSLDIVAECIFEYEIGE